MTGVGSSVSEVHIASKFRARLLKVFHTAEMTTEKMFLTRVVAYSSLRTHACAVKHVSVFRTAVRSECQDKATNTVRTSSSANTVPSDTVVKLGASRQLLGSNPVSVTTPLHSLSHGPRSEPSQSPCSSCCSWIPPPRRLNRGKTWR